MLQNASKIRIREVCENGKPCKCFENGMGFIKNERQLIVLI